VIDPNPDVPRTCSVRQGAACCPAAELTFQQRLSHGLSYLVSYTRWRLIDDASSVFDASILTDTA